jgi:hypothetical protein
MYDLFVEPIVGRPEQFFFSWLDEMSTEWLRSSFTTSPNFLAWSPLNRTGAVHNHRFKCQTPLLGEHHLQSFSPKNNRSYPTAGPRTRPISQVAPAPRTVAAICCPNCCSITGFHGTSENPTPSSSTA